MKVRIHVTLKPGILAPQGKTLLHALGMLGLAGVHDVRVGKVIEMTFDGVAPARARELAEEACQKLLANLVIENYSVVLAED